MQAARIPNPPSLETAIRLYYSRLILSAGDIRQLFGCGYNKAEKLKAIAAEAQRQSGVMFMDITKVDTQTAFSAWGLDINDLERRYKKIKAL